MLLKDLIWLGLRSASTFQAIVLLQTPKGV